MKKILLTLSLAIAILGVSSPASAHSEATPHGVIISTGSEQGLYHKTGQTLCELLIAKGVKCKAQPSQGSISNLMAIAGDNVTFGMVQSDWQFHAIHTSKKWKGPNLSHLRAIFSLYPEPM